MSFPASETGPTRSSLLATEGALAVLGLAAIGLFALYTGGWTVEDACIVARVARNFALHGELTFHPGTMVSVATSTPFALAMGLLASAGAPPLAAAKLAGAAATLGSACVVHRLVRRFEEPPYPFLAAALFLLFPGTVAYALAGLETPVYTLVCLLCLSRCALGLDRASIAWGAVAAAVRPDGLLALGVAVAAAALRQRRLPSLARTVLPGGALLLASALAHRAAYGSWLPHSAVAKGLVYDLDARSNLLFYGARLFRYDPSSPLPVDPGTLLLAALAVGGMVAGIRRHPALGWVVAWYLLYNVAFAVRAPKFEWYRVPPEAVVALFAALGLAAAARRVPRLRRLALDRPVASGGVAFVLALALALPPLADLAGRKRRDQAYNERVLAAAGSWLGGHAARDDLVFTESLGFLGWTSDLPMVDWPGLTDPALPALVRGLSPLAGYARVIEARRPRWLALRAPEWEGLRPDLRARYRPALRLPSPVPARPALVVARLRRGAVPPAETATAEPR